MTPDEGARIIPGSGHALGFRGNKPHLEQVDEMLAREFRRYLIGVEMAVAYVGYFKDHPEHIEPYRAFFTTPPNPEPLSDAMTELNTALAAMTRLRDRMRDAGL